jgi:hypothetical protein
VATGGAADTEEAVAVAMLGGGLDDMGAAGGGVCGETTGATAWTGAGLGAVAAGEVGATVTRGGSSPSGSTYPSSSDARRIPRWTLGTDCSGVPLVPIVPTVAPSETVSPFATPIVPRWTRVTAYPSAVRIVTPRP